MPSLFDPLKVGALTLPNRIVLSPLTRSRAHPDTRVPSDLAVEYYRQRAGAGMMLTEATSVTPMGVGYAATPGIWSDEQTEGWKKVTAAVHGAGGRILLQLWHVGRISAPAEAKDIPPSTQIKDCLSGLGVNGRSRAPWSPPPSSHPCS